MVLWAGLGPTPDVTSALAMWADALGIDVSDQPIARREGPTSQQAAHLRAEFDVLFSTVTGYQALDNLIAKTRTNQARLLLVLDFPELPLHHNQAELAARQRVRKRDISFGPRTSDGVAAWDTFMTLADTAKKLGVNFYAYIQDRVSRTYYLPDLADLINQQSVPAYDNAAPS